MTVELIDDINDKFYLKWSLEQISGWLLVEQEICISHEIIDQHVWADKAIGGDWYKYGRRRARQYKVRGSNGTTCSGQIKKRVSIDDRPIVVDEKSRVDFY